MGSFFSHGFTFMCSSPEYLANHRVFPVQRIIKSARGFCSSIVVCKLPVYVVYLLGGFAALRVSKLLKDKDTCDKEPQDKQWSYLMMFHDVP